MTGNEKHMSTEHPQLIETPRPFMRPVPIRDLGPGCMLYLAWDSPGAGGTWRDRSGQGNHGSITGATWADTPWGRALEFDGVDDNVEIQNSSSLQLDDDFTIILWFKSSQNSRAYLIRRYPPGRYNFLIILNSATGNGAIRAGIYDGTNYPWSSVGSGLNDGKWHQVAFRRIKQNELKIFIDGTAYTSITDTTTGSITGSVSTLIGPQYDNYFNGIISEVRIYNRALSSAEITQHYWEETPYA